MSESASSIRPRVLLQVLAWIPALTSLSDGLWPRSINLINPLLLKLLLFRVCFFVVFFLSWQQKESQKEQYTNIPNLKHPKYGKHFEQATCNIYSPGIQRAKCDGVCTDGWIVPNSLYYMWEDLENWEALRGGKRDHSLCGGTKKDVLSRWGRRGSANVRAKVRTQGCQKQDGQKWRPSQGWLDQESLGEVYLASTATFPKL